MDTSISGIKKGVKFYDKRTINVLCKFYKYK